MDRKELVQTALLLKKASDEAIKELIDSEDRIASLVNENMLSRDDINDLIGGEKNIQMMKDNHNNHLRFIISILRTPNPDVLTDTIRWVFRSYKSRGFHSNYWAAQISTWIAIFKQQLTPKAFSEIYPLYEWLSVNIPSFSDLSDNEIKLYSDH